MRKFLPYIPQNNGKKGKKACINIIDTVKIWKKYEKKGKNLFDNFTIDFYQYFTTALSLYVERILPFFLFFQEKYCRIQERDG